jgi:hypothetical protein
MGNHQKYYGSLGIGVIRGRASILPILSMLYAWSQLTPAILAAKQLPRALCCLRVCQAEDD